MNQTPVLFMTPSLLLFCGVFLDSNSTIQAQTAADVVDITPDRIKTIPHDMTKGQYPFDEGGYYRVDWVDGSAMCKGTSTTVQSPIPRSSSEHPLNPNNNRKQSKPEIASKPIVKTIVEKRHSSPKPPRQTPPPPPKKADPPVINPGPPRVMTDEEAKAEGFIGPWSEMQEKSWNIPQLKVPSFTSLTRKPAETQPKKETSSNTAPIYHKVDVGDTLFGISQKYDISVDAIKRANGLTSDLIKVGQSLRLALAQHALGISQQ